MRFIAKLLRRKVLDTSPSLLHRSLGFVSLTALGVGATLGAGVYVLTGVVGQKVGPAIVISFFISGVASILSGLCYAEFGSRVPRAGSAYVYAYVTVGELLAWTTGWQLLLEYIIGAASVARSWSGYLDSLAGQRLSVWMNATLGGWTTPGLAQYPDVIAAAATLALAGIVSFGVKESTTLNNVLTALNLIVIAFMIIAGLFFVETKNFTPFAPTGFSGIFKGAATCFYAYVGFDVIATSAEEALNPSRTIPASIIASLLLCAFTYMGVAGVVTLMVPYATLDASAPLAAAFGAHGAQWAQYFIAVGGVAGLSTSLMTCIFPMPRIVYAISADGLLPPWVGRVHPRFGTPALATMLCGGFAAFMALIFDISALADMMSIGTLVAYTLVAASVLVLRYREEEDAEDAAAAAEASVEGVGGRRGSVRVTARLSTGGNDADGEDAVDGETETGALMGGRGGGRRGGAGGGGREQTPSASTLSTSSPLLSSDFCSEAFELWGMRPYAAASFCLCLFVVGCSVASAVSVCVVCSRVTAHPPMSLFSRHRRLQM